MQKQFWIDIQTSKRRLAIYKGGRHIYVEGGGKLRNGRELTEIERILAEEIFSLRDAAQPRNAGDVAPMGESETQSGDLAQRA